MFSLRRALWKAAGSLMRVRNFNVSVIGGASELGQATCMLLRSEPGVTRLSVYDSLPSTTGTILDLSHIPAEATVRGFTGENNLHKSMEDADIVLVTGGSLDCPGVDSKDIFVHNTQFIRTVATALSEIRPFPFVGIATEPINALVPMAAEIIRCSGENISRKLFGITGLDAIRAQTYYAATCDLKAEDCVVPVIGGHSEKTIVPLLSQAVPCSKLTKEQCLDLVRKIRSGDELITSLKNGHGLTLATAYSVVTFTRALLRALDGKLTPVHAFVENNDFGTSYFAGQVYVDKNGAGEMHRYNKLTDYECELLDESITCLRNAISSGKRVVEFD